MEKMSFSKASIFASSAIATCLVGAGVAQAQPAAVIAVSSPAVASSASNGDSTQLGEVIVTARKRAESAINVPIAIQSFSAKDLKQNNITNLRDVAALTPGLTFQDVNGAYAAPVIRGMEQVDQTSLQGNVGVFVDGVYLNNRSGLQFGLLELNRIEVDKGPQSALYGRNTFSGAINYITVGPTLDRLKGDLSVEEGDYGRQTYKGGVNIPLGDKVAVRLFGGWGKFDGTTKNLRDGDDIGGYKDEEAYGAALLAKPINDLTIHLYYSESKIDNNALPLYSVPISKNNCGSQSVRPNGTFYTLYCGGTPNVTSVNVNDTTGFGTIGNTRLAYASADYNLHFATVSGTISYEKGKFSNLIDTTADPNAIATSSTAFAGYSNQNYVSSVTPESKDISLDLKIASNPGGKLNWLLGFYAYDSNLVNITAVSHQLLNQPNSTPVVFSTSGGELRSHGRAGYGMVSYDFTDKWNVSAEARYTSENQYFSGVGSNVTATVNGVVTPVVGRQNSGLWAPRFTSNYKITPDTVAYVSVARGVKSGGFNANAFALGDYFAFAPETNWTYELGVKNQFFNKRLQINADVFDINWNHIQGQTYVGGSILSAVTNLGGATSKGVEVDAQYFITPTLSVRLGGDYADPKYKKGFIDGDVSAACGDYKGTTLTAAGCSDDVGGDQMARTSKYQAVGSVHWDLPNLIYGVNGYVNGDYSYEAGKYTDGLDNNTQGPIRLVNGRVGLVKDNVEFSFWVKNLFDVTYVDRVTISASATDGAPASGIDYIRVYPGERRTFGGQFEYHF